MDGSRRRKIQPGTKKNVRKPPPAANFGGKVPALPNGIDREHTLRILSAVCVLEPWTQRQSAERSLSRPLQHGPDPKAVGARSSGAPTTPIRVESGRPPSPNIVLFDAEITAHPATSVTSPLVSSWDEPSPEIDSPRAHPGPPRAAPCPGRSRAVAPQMPHGFAAVRGNRRRDPQSSLRRPPRITAAAPRPVPACRRSALPDIRYD